MYGGIELKMVEYVCVGLKKEVRRAEGFRAFAEERRGWDEEEEEEIKGHVGMLCTEGGGGGGGGKRTGSNTLFKGKGEGRRWTVHFGGKVQENGLLIDFFQYTGKGRTVEGGMSSAEEWVGTKNHGGWTAPDGQDCATLDFKRMACLFSVCVCALCVCVCVCVCVC